jgi:putative addiction module component (TIGR02574 family)
VTKAANRVLEEALKLPADERAALAAELIVSLEDTDEDVQRAWAAEIERRSQLAGQEPGEDWRVVLDQVSASVRSR